MFMLHGVMLYSWIVSIFLSIVVVDVYGLYKYAFDCDYGNILSSSSYYYYQVVWIDPLKCGTSMQIIPQTTYNLSLDIARQWQDLLMVMMGHYYLALKMVLYEVCLYMRYWVLLYSWIVSIFLNPSVWCPQRGRTIMLHPFFECTYMLSFGTEVWMDGCCAVGWR